MAGNVCTSSSGWFEFNSNSEPVPIDSHGKMSNVTAEMKQLDTKRGFGLSFLSDDSCVGAEFVQQRDTKFN